MEAATTVVAAAQHPLQASCIGWFVLSKYYRQKCKELLLLRISMDLFILYAIPFIAIQLNRILLYFYLCFIYIVVIFIVVAVVVAVVAQLIA